MKIPHLIATASVFAGFAAGFCAFDLYRPTYVALINFAFFGWRAIVALLENPPKKD